MHPVVEVHVLCGGSGPAEVARHCLGYEAVPCLAVVPEQAGAAEHRIAHLLAVEVGEGEAGPLACDVVVRYDRILEAARLAHYRQRAVAHGDHLGKAARLEEGGHEEEVGTCVHALGERGVELDPRCHLSGILGCEVAQRVLVFGIARAEHGYLDASGEDAVERVGYEVHALLACEARNHGHEGLAFSHGQAELFLQPRLADGLAGAVSDVEVLRDGGIRRGVEMVDVDTVDDALQVLSAASQHPIEPLAERGGLDLACIGWGYGGYGVAVVERALHEVDGVGSAGELERGCRNVGEAADVFEHGCGELPLKRNVVDGEDGLYVFVERKSLVELAEKYGRESGVPIVAMKDVGSEAFGEVLKALADRLGEECEALAVVEEAVGIVAIEVALVVDEDVCHSVVLQALESAVLIAPAEAHVEVSHVLHLLLVSPGYGPV